MNLEQIKEILSENGYFVTGEKDMGHGIQLKLSTGAIVNVFQNGTINTQGKNTEALKALFGLEKTNLQSNYDMPIKATNLKKKDEVFVVYGHDDDARTQLEAMLRRWNLKPLILDQLPSEGQTIIEKLERHSSAADFCVVLATPDDEGYRRGKDDEKAFRARQNVVLELGMMLSRLGRDRVAILLKDQTKMERPSDIQGLIYIAFKDDIKEAGLLLAKEMVAKGYSINIKDL